MLLVKKFVAKKSRNYTWCYFWIFLASYRSWLPSSLPLEMPSTIATSSKRYANKSSWCLVSTCWFIEHVPNNLYVWWPFSSPLFFSTNAKGISCGKQMLKFNCCSSSQLGQSPLFTTKNAHGSIWCWGSRKKKDYGIFIGPFFANNI